MEVCKLFMFVESTLTNEWLTECPDAAVDSKTERDLPNFYWQIKMEMMDGSILKSCSSNLH